MDEGRVLLKKNSEEAQWKKKIGRRRREKKKRWMSERYQNKGGVLLLAGWMPEWDDVTGMMENLGWLANWLGGKVGWMDG